MNLVDKIVWLFMHIMRPSVQSLHTHRHLPTCTCNLQYQLLLAVRKKRNLRDMASCFSVCVCNTQAHAQPLYVTFLVVVYMCHVVTRTQRHFQHTEVANGIKSTFGLISTVGVSMHLLLIFAISVLMHSGSNRLTNIPLNRKYIQIQHVQPEIKAKEKGQWGRHIIQFTVYLHEMMYNFQKHIP